MLILLVMAVSADTAYFYERIDKMAEYSNVPVQTVAVNQTVIFSENAFPCNRGNVIHRQGSGNFTLRGANCSGCQCWARYRVSFGANIAIPADGVAASPISLAIAVDGEPLGSATMIETPAVVSQFNNVFSSVIVQVPRGCCVTVSVENNGVQTVDVQNANIIIERIA